MVKFEGIGKAVSDLEKFLNNLNKIESKTKILSKSYNKYFQNFSNKIKNPGIAGGSSISDFFNNMMPEKGTLGSPAEYGDMGGTIFSLISDGLLKKAKLPNSSSIMSFLEPFSKIKDISEGQSILMGVTDGFGSFFKILSGGFSGLMTVVNAAAMALAPLLAKILLIGAAALFAAKLLSTMWKVNTGGIQTSVNALGGKWRAGMAKMDIAFIKLGRALDPLIRPIVKFTEILLGGLIDGLFYVISGITEFITIIVNMSNVIQGVFKMIFGTLYTVIGNFLNLIGIGGIHASLGSYLSETGREQYETGLSGFIKKDNTQAVTNNNITFNVGGSNMNEDAYMLFANRILQQIA